MSDDTDDLRQEIADEVNATQDAAHFTAAKYTPGPWYVTPDYDGKLAVNNHTEFPSEFPIAAVGGPLTDKEANANLIAAAPELLEALENLRSYFEYQKEHGSDAHPINPAYLDQAGAVIKKARKGD